MRQQWAREKKNKSLDVANWNVRSVLVRKMKVIRMCNKSQQCALYSSLIYLDEYANEWWHDEICVD